MNGDEIKLFPIVARENSKSMLSFLHVVKNVGLEKRRNDNADN